MSTIGSTPAAPSNGRQSSLAPRGTTTSLKSGDKTRTLSTTQDAVQVAPSLVRRLLWQLESALQGEEPEGDSSAARRALVTAPYRAKGYLRRRAPDEIESVLATIGQEDLHMVLQSFGSKALTMQHFAEAIVRTGTYDTHRIAAFVGGVVDLFYEILRSQADRAESVGGSAVVNLEQLMNHLIELPEVAAPGSEASALSAVTHERGSEKLPQVHRNAYVDSAKHQGVRIEKLYWIPAVDKMATVEGTDSIYLWSPHTSSDPTPVTPQLPPDMVPKGGKPLFTVLAAAWDPELQDLVALLSNRMLIMWRLRSRERGQFQQKEKKYRFHSSRDHSKPDGWKVFLSAIDPRTGEFIKARGQTPGEDQDQTEKSMRREKRDERQAADASTQLDIWWNTNLKLWVTTDRQGRLYLWDLRSIEGSFFIEQVLPQSILTSHTSTVTSHLEIGKHKFTTCSLDRTVILWDNRNLTVEHRIEEHTCSVLSQAYLPTFSSLVTVGCERRVYVWSIDSTTYRGLRAKLPAHQANVLQVTAGQRLFFTLDEANTLIMWDGASLAFLQVCNCATLAPRIALCLPTLGRVCLAGRRLNFYEGNELAQLAIGAVPTKEQTKTAIIEEGGVAAGSASAGSKNAAVPQWCGLSAVRGCLISVTDKEVRLHQRGCPTRSHKLFKAEHGDAISAFAAAEQLSVAVLGTERGSIYFLKYRSGFVQRVYWGRREDREEWQKGGGGATSLTTSAAMGEAEAGMSEAPSGGPSPSRASGRAVAAEPTGQPPPSRLPSATPPPPQAGASGTKPGGKASAPAGASLQAPSLIAGEDAALPDEEDLEHAPQGPTTASAVMQSAPTEKEIQLGLSSHITAVAACEPRREVFVGTAEGHIIVFASDQGFSPIRRLVHPDDSSAVTCLHCQVDPVSRHDDEDLGVLLVGTQDGSANIYMLTSLRLAGTIKVPRMLPDAEGSGVSPALRYLRLFRVSADASTPLTLLSIDAQSRLRLWGISIQVRSGKMREQKLLCDCGQLREGDCIPPDGAKAGKGEAAAKAKLPNDGVIPQVAESRRGGRQAVRVTAIATMSGSLLSPAQALLKQPNEGPRPASVRVETLRKQSKLGAEAAAAFAAAASPKGAGAAAFMTQPTLPGADAAGLQQLQPGDLSGSETDGDTDDDVGQRLLRTPASGVPANSETIDGANLLFAADSGGWLWCFDMAASVVGAANCKQEAAALRRKEHYRNRASAAMNNSGLMNFGAASAKHEPVPLKPHPEAMHVVGAWPAHHAEVVSLVPTHSPPALVSVDAANEIKVWSTNGDLWGHFSTVSTAPEVPPPLAVWPPPHVLSMQVALMRQAKTLCRRLGFNVRSTVRHKHGPRGRSELHRSSSSLEHQGGGGGYPASEGRTLSALPSQGALSVGTSPASPTSEQFSPTSAVFSPDAAGERRRTTRKSRFIPEHLVTSYSAITEGSSVTGADAESADGDQDSEDEEAGSDGAEEAPAEEEEEDEEAEEEVEEDAAASGSKRGSSIRGSLRSAAPLPLNRLSSKGTSPRGSGAHTVLASGEASPSHRSAVASEAAEPVSPLPGGSGAGGRGGLRAADRKKFTSGQLGEMIRNHAFSAGCQSYPQFVRKGGARDRRTSPKGVESMDQPLARNASSFGLELVTDHDTRAWEDPRTPGMGTRSSSEGALLRYATRAADDLTRQVRDTLGVDVRTLSRKEINRPSFIARLDVGGVSTDPQSPTSATAQAVRRVCGREKVQRVSLPFLSTESLASGGAHLGRSRNKRGKPSRFTDAV